MKEILDSATMRRCDQRTIEEHHVPSLVLMERAALSVAVEIRTNFKEALNITVVCGPGNNGGDGVAIARMLKIAGKNVRCIVLGNQEKFTEQLSSEIAMAESYGLKIEYDIDEEAFEKADLVVDAMFGIGLTRGLSGQFEYAAQLMNQCALQVVAVDIPSGYDADCGKLLGQVGVQAHTTVTFAYMKKGLVLGDCKKAAGKVIVADVGIYLDREKDSFATIVDSDILHLLPPRPVDANKGTCGKLLVIAGSKNIYGACYLSAKAALRAGTGLVKIYTHTNNIASIQQGLPEAMYLGYTEYNKEELLQQISWADTILMGPGLGTSELSQDIVKTVLENPSKPMIIDADGLNIAAQNKELLKQAAAKAPIIITPHLKEMERLCGTPVAQINNDMENVAKSFADEYKITVILKNFTTIIASANTINYVTSGDEGLATPGSGDVLAGIVSSLVGQKILPQIAVLAATYIHGAAGHMASEELGTRAVLASDIIENIHRF